MHFRLERLRRLRAGAHSKLGGKSSRNSSRNEAERAALQAETQEYFELFKSHVLANRQIANDDMRRQAFVGVDALKRELVDEICDEKTAYNKLKILTTC